MRGVANVKNDGRFSVLVTGGAGYIGSHVSLALLDAGYHVAVIDDLSTGHRWQVDPRVRFIEGTIDNASLVDCLIEMHHVDAILHFAGSVIVPESVSDPLKYYRNNTAASRALVDSAIRGRVRHFVFSSTAATYGTPESIPVREDAPLRPINPYGQSKLMTEMMLRDVAAVHRMNYCALRYFNVAGADPLGRTGQSTVGATHLVKVAVEAALGKRDSVSVFGTDFDTPDGTGVRDYIHVTDLAHAHVSALTALINQPNRNLTLNCGYGRGFSVLDVLDAVERVSKIRINRKFAPRRPGDPAMLVADNSAILSTLDWRPKHDGLDEIVASAFRWERQLPNAAPASISTQDPIQPVA